MTATNAGGDPVIAIVDGVAADLEAAQERLTQLDSALGDGDHGVTMTIGARAVRKELGRLEGRGVAEIVQRCGASFQAAAGATVGALLGAGLLSAARELAGADRPGLEQMSRALDAANLRIQELGKARVGEKTLVDAIDPAARALREAVAEGKGADEAMSCMLEAARRGMQATTDMLGTKGRASRLGERTRGHQDPGATSCYLILESIVRLVKQNASRP